MSEWDDWLGGGAKVEVRRQAIELEVLTEEMPDGGVWYRGGPKVAGIGPNVLARVINKDALFEWQIDKAHREHRGVGKYLSAIWPSYGFDWGSVAAWRYATALEAAEHASRTGNGVREIEVMDATGTTLRVWEWDGTERKSAWGREG